MWWMLGGIFPLPFSEERERAPRLIIHQNGGKKGKEKRTVSALKRWSRTRSKRGTTDLIDLNVAWAYFI